MKHKSDDLQTQLDQANSDRDDWKNRVDTISHERDDLMEKLKNPPVKIVYKDRIVTSPAAAPAAEENNPNPAAPAVDVTSAQGDQYWASVLKAEGCFADRA